MPFEQYQTVEYDGLHGYIDFVDDAYITICVAVKDRHCEDTACLRRENRCCVLVYPKDWQHVKHIEECNGPIRLGSEQGDDDATMEK